MLLDEPVQNDEGRDARRKENDSENEGSGGYEVQGEDRDEDCLEGDVEQEWFEEDWFEPLRMSVLSDSKGFYRLVRDCLESFTTI